MGKKIKKFISFYKPWITNEEIKEVEKVIRSGWLTMGPKVLEFEEKFRKYIGAKYAIAVNSCTAGLFLSLVSLGIGKDHEVITTVFSFASTANTIVHTGAKPVFVDISRDTFNIDPSAIEKVINKRTKAIVVVHYGGRPCQMDKILKIARKYHLKVIEDCAHAPGAEYKNKKVGTFGDTASFSFYATKNLTTGEGGMITTNNKKLADRLRILRLHGISKDAWKRYSKGGEWYYEIIEAGFKYNMTDIQAALGLVQLKKLDYLNEIRRRQARYLMENLKNVPEIQLPIIGGRVKNVWHLFPILIRPERMSIDRDKFIKELNRYNIGTSVHFIPFHLHPFYRKRFGYKKGDFPNAEYVYNRIISLPFYPKMRREDYDYVVRAIKSIIKKYKK